MFVQINISNERVSKTPFTKWYIKGYHIKYVYTKLTKAIEEKDPSKLNSNLKVIYNQIIENEKDKIQ